jgi:peptidoglycan/LPS O-acetylase OafA/YrhL
VKNNFDFLRLLFATFVVITHSYVLSGSEENDLMFELTNGQASFSYIGVRGFFVISGFLIFQSLSRSPTLLQYYKKRFLRVFPALFVVLVLTIVFGVVVYEHELVGYIENRSVWTYVPNNLVLFRPQHSINGIFENNPYRSAINGSLWTIPYEVALYIFISALFFLKAGKKKVGLVICVGLLAVGRFFFYEELSPYGFSVIWSRYILDVGLYFFAGAFLASVAFDKWANLTGVLIISSGLLILSFLIDVFDKGQYLFLPLAIISFGSLSTKYINNLKETTGDISYGIYLYNFPIQQTLVFYFSPHYLHLMFYSMLLSSMAGYFSWHCIEKKSLQLKRIFFRKDFSEPLSTNYNTRRD